MKSRPPTSPSEQDPRALLRRYHDDHHEMVERTLAARGVPDADRPDLVQDVYIAAFRGLQKGEVIDEPPAWMRRIALRRALNYRRSRKMARPVALDMIEELSSGMDDGPEKYVGDRELLASLLDELDLDVQSIVLSRWVEELSWEEVARQHKITIHRAEYLYEKAFVAMKAALERCAKAEPRRGMLLAPVTLEHLRDACKMDAEITMERRRQSWASIQRRIEALNDAEVGEAKDRAPPPSIEREPPRPASSSPRWLSFVAGGLAGFLLAHLLPEARSSSPEIVPSRPAAPGPTLVMASPAPVILAFSASPVEPASEAREPPRPPKSAPPGAAPDYVLLDQARAAIEAGEATRALRVLQSCKGGQLSTVWQGLWAKACASPEARGEKECVTAR